MRAVLWGLVLASGGLALGQDEDVPNIERPKIAQEEQPVIEVNVPSLNTRSGAPIPLKWTTKWKGKGVLEGNLKFQVLDEGRLLGRFTIEDLALTGEQTFRTMLPALSSPVDIDVCDVKLEFVTKDRTYALPTQAIKIPQRSTRHAVILLCDASDVSLSPDATHLIEALSVTQFEPDRRMLVTQNARYRSQDMPQDPLSLCGFDMVAVTPQSFPSLKESQLLALKQWVEAGGSLFITPGSGLQAWHVKFLADLAREDFPNVVVEKDARGKLTGFTDRRGWVPFHCGLGRAVLTLDLTPPKSDERTSGQRRVWEQLAAFLWRVRADRLENLALGSWHPGGGAAPPEPPAQLNRFNGFASGEAPKSIYYPRLAQVGKWLLDKLLPERVQVVPLGILAAILAIYLVVIGPVEYWGLGAVRLRRLTWVLFPLTTFAFTGGILWLSNRYMYSEVQSRSVTFVDVVDDGRVVRQDRLELLFTNTSRKLVHDIPRGYRTPLNLTVFGATVDTRRTENDLYDGYNELRERAPFRADASKVETVEYVGRIPGHSKVLQDVPQWTPNLNRTMVLAPDVPKVDFSWKAFGPVDFATEAGRKRLSEVILAKFGPETSAYLFGGSGHGFTAIGREGAVAIHEGSKTNPLEFLAATCCAARIGLPNCIFRQSPSGGSNLEDLPLLDSDSTEEWLLVIFTPQKDDYVVYRRLYR